MEIFELRNKVIVTQIKDKKRNTSAEILPTIELHHDKQIFSVLNFS